MATILKDIWFNLVEKDDVLAPYSKFGALLMERNLVKQYADKMEGKTITEEENRQLDDVSAFYQTKLLPKYRRDFFGKVIAWLVFLSIIAYSSWP